MALVRIARIEDLESLDTLVDRLTALEAGGPPPRSPAAASAKKKGGRAETAGSPPMATPPAGHENEAGERESGAGARSVADRSQAGATALPPGQAGLAPASDESTAGSGDRREAPVDTRRDEPAADEPAALDLETALRAWPKVVAKMKGNWRLTTVEPVAILAPDVVVIAPKPDYNNIDEMVGRRRRSVSSAMRSRRC